MSTAALPHEPSESASQRRERAVQILELSRAQIQAELTGETSGGHSSPWDLLGLLGKGSARRGAWRLVRQRLRMGRAGRAVVGLIERWWEHHPLRLPLTVLSHEVKGRMPAVVQRHPAACAVAAAAAGFALIKWRSWWWPRLKLGTRRLPRRLLSLLWIELAHPQVQASLIGALMSDRADAPDHDARSDDEPTTPSETPQPA